MDDDKIDEWKEAIDNAEDKDSKNVLKTEALLNMLEDLEEARDQAEENQRLYKAITENTSDHIALLKLDTTYLYLNPSNEKLGYSPDELVGKKAIDMIHPDDRKKLKSVLARYTIKKISSLFRKEETVSERFTYRFPDKSGKWHDMDAVGNPIPNPAGEGYNILVVSRDITEEKRTLEKLKESEERFRMAFDYAPVGYYISDTKGVFIDGNKEAERIIGYKKDDLIGKNYFDVGLLTKKSVPLAVKILALNTAGKPTGPDEFELVRKDGKHVNLEVWTYPVRLKGKRVVLGAVLDITKRKMAEEDLKKERSLLEKYLNLSQVIMLAVDSDFKVKLINQKGADILGYKKSDIIGKDWISNFIPKEYREQLRQYGNELLSGKRDPMDYNENPVLTKKGEQRLIGWHNTVIRDDEGNFVSHLSSGQDITDKKRAEKEIYEKSERLSALFENAADAIFVADAETRDLTDCNNAAEDMTGYSKKKLLSMKADQLHPKDVLKKTMDGFRKQAKGQIKTVGSEVLTKNKKRIPVTINSSAFKMNDKKYLIGIFREKIMEKTKDA
ncbi:PAS domain S-box protein [Candidatus Woesearchaeota archaeon]|nr:PAS domain S-box protein [Candidatus Woesearchaeota archaeon]